MTGFTREYSDMARYAGLDMAIMSEGKWGMLKLCIWMSMSRGRALEYPRLGIEVSDSEAEH